VCDFTLRPTFYGLQQVGKQNSVCPYRCQIYNKMFIVYSIAQ
jgi:hypothetical protein